MTVNLTPITARPHLNKYMWPVKLYCNCIVIKGYCCIRLEPPWFSRCSTWATVTSPHWHWHSSIYNLFNLSFIIYTCFPLTTLSVNMTTHKMIFLCFLYIICHIITECFMRPPHYIRYTPVWRTDTCTSGIAYGYHALPVQRNFMHFRYRKDQPVHISRYVELDHVISLIYEEHDWHVARVNVKVRVKVMVISECIMHIQHQNQSR